MNEEQLQRIHDENFPERMDVLCCYCGHLMEMRRDASKPVGFEDDEDGTDRGMVLCFGCMRLNSVDFLTRQAHPPRQALIDKWGEEILRFTINSACERIARKHGFAAAADHALALYTRYRNNYGPPPAT